MIETILPADAVQISDQMEIAGTTFKVFSIKRDSMNITFTLYAKTDELLIAELKMLKITPVKILQ